MSKPYNPLFIQIHTIHEFHAALINRDENGNAKRMDYADSVRTRISSQCQKWHWRNANDEHAIGNIEGVNGATRSRNIINRMVMPALQESGAFQPEVLDAVENGFNIGVYGSSATTEAQRQTITLGAPEIAHLTVRARRICEAHPEDVPAAIQACKDLFNQKRGEGQNFRAMLSGVQIPEGWENSLFGRMLTSDTAANMDAAIHVGHALTVHPQQSELDFFTVVDDLQRRDDSAQTSHLNRNELTSGLFYNIVVIDVPELVSNLNAVPTEEWREANPEIAAQIAENLIHLIAKVSPAAKKGSTASYGWAEFMMVEVGRQQPRSLMGAFRKASGNEELDGALASLRRRLERMDQVFDSQERRIFFTTEDCEMPRAVEGSMDEVSKFTGDAIRNRGA